MNRRTATFLFAALLAGFPGVRAADNGLWKEGKDRPTDRVNLGLKSLAPDAYLRISEQADEAVVNISTSKIFKPNERGNPRRPHPFNGGPRNRGQQPPSPFDEFFDRFFGGPGGEAPNDGYRQQSLGSGFVLNSDGYIVTNNHVIEGADEIKVILHDESEKIAKVIGRDPKTDIALLKIEPGRKLRSVILGDSDQLKVGEIVVAIGNPFGLSHSLTQGIVSAKERSIGFGNYDDFIQTDASINPGNSGGPLLNLQGEVIGINAAIVASGNGIGFAIPINLAKKILLELKRQGRVVRGWLGVKIQKVDDEHVKALKLKERAGALVSEVLKGGPAALVGIQAGDVVTRFEDKKIKDWRELPITVAGTPVGKKAEIEIVRNGSVKTMTVEIAELPKDEGEGTEADESSSTSDQLGLTVASLTPEMRRSMRIDESVEGVMVGSVKAESTAYEKGVREGDVVVEVNRERTPTAAAYERAASKLKKGQTALLLIKRGEGTLFIAFTL